MLSDTEVERIAQLARIELTSSEKQTLKKDLSSILDYIAKLNEVKTDGVEPLYQTTGLLNSTREDKVRNEFKPGPQLDKVLLDQAPKRKDRFVQVKSILSKK